MQRRFAGKFKQDKFCLVRNSQAAPNLPRTRKSQRAPNMPRTDKSNSTKSAAFCYSITFTVKVENLHMMVCSQIYRLMGILTVYPKEGKLTKLIIIKS
jgi:hypothetical protein